MRVFKMSRGGGYCIFEENNLQTLIVDLQSLGDIGSKFTIEVLEMTQDELDKLPESDGDY
jgi:hypothetical protein